MHDNHLGAITPLEPHVLRNSTREVENASYKTDFLTSLNVPVYCYSFFLSSTPLFLVIKFYLGSFIITVTITITITIITKLNKL